MSGENSQLVTYLHRVIALGGRTGFAIRASISRRDGLSIVSVVTVAYLVLYLYGIGHLGRGDGSVNLIVVDEPLTRMTEQVAPFQYEAIALVGVGPLELLIAPLNLAVGIFLAALVGINLAVAWVAWRGPAACRIGPGAGMTAGLPGLLSSFICCGPTILLVVGVQASAGLIAAFQWFLPLAVVLLVGTLLWVGNKVEPA